MVFRKPFAFIIRHFKAFHIVMLFTSIFILYSSSQIRSLIASLIKTNAYMYAGANNYTKSPIYMIALIGLAAVGAIYWLFKVRKKDLRYYRLVVIYYISAIFGHYYMFGALNKMATEQVSIDTLNAVRDISLMLFLASLPIVVMSFVRGVGFNIKQFNFSKDIEELSITEKDSEEFEILIGQNNYKYIRKGRKIIRELRYLVLENLFYISIVGAGLILVGGISVGAVIYKNAHTVAESQITTINNVYYAVNNTYITERDINGNTLKKGYKYVVVNLSMKNLSTYEKRYVDQGLFTLQTGRLIYKPINYFQKKFLDMGVYLEKGTEIPTDSFLTGNVVFEIPASMNVTHFNFRVMSGIEETDDEFLVNYVRFVAAGKEVDREISTINLSKGQRINTNIIEGSLFNIVIKDASLLDAYDERYVICKTPLLCDSKTSLVKPTTTSTNTMIALFYDGVLDSNATYYNALDTMEEFVNAYTHVEYTIGNKSYSSDSNVIMKDINGKIFMEVTRDITKANSITVVFNFRNETYNLKIR